MDFLEPFSLGPSLVVLTCVAAALLLSHALLLAAALGLRLEKRAAGLTRLSAGLGVAGPLAVCILMVFVVQDGIAQMLPGHDEPVVVMGRSAAGLARAMNGWWIGGLGLLGLALLSPIGLAVLRWRVRGGGPRPDPLLRAVAVIALLGGLLGGAVVYRVHGMTTGFAALAGATAVSRAQFLVMLLTELPSLSWLAIALAGMALAGAFAVISGREAGGKQGGGRALLVVALGVFLLGGLAFVGTRPHAADMQGVLPPLFERLRASDDRSILLPVRADLPALTHVRKLALAPAITVRNRQVILDGVPVSGRGLTTQEDPLVIELAERLERLEKQWQAIHPGEQHDPQAILQLDVDTPAALLGRVLAACRRAGHHTVQLATRETTTISSEVLGPLTLNSYRALFVDLVEPGSAEAQPWRDESYGDLAARLDRAAKDGRVRLELPGETAPVVEERPPAGSPGGGG